MKTIEFRRRRIFERVEDGAWSDAIVKYRSSPFLFEDKGLYILHTYRCAIRIDLFFFDVRFEWEKKEKQSRLKDLNSFFPHGATMGVDMGRGQSISVNQDTIGPILKEAKEKLEKMPKAVWSGVYRSEGPGKITIKVNKKDE